MSDKLTGHEKNGSYITAEWMEQRAADLGAMDANVLMRNSGILDDDGLARYMESGQLQGEGDGFYGFSILFGLDENGQDFVVVRSDTQGALHFVIAVDDRSVQ